MRQCRLFNGHLLVGGRVLAGSLVSNLVFLLCYIWLPAVFGIALAQLLWIFYWLARQRGWSSFQRGETRYVTQERAKFYLHGSFIQLLDSDVVVLKVSNLPGVGKVPEKINFPAGGEHYFSLHSTPTFLSCVYTCHTCHTGSRTVFEKWLCLPGTRELDYIRRTREKFYSSLSRDWSLRNQNGILVNLRRKWWLANEVSLRSLGGITIFQKPGFASTFEKMIFYPYESIHSCIRCKM